MNTYVTIAATIVCGLFAQDVWEGWYLPHDGNHGIENVITARGDFDEVWYVGYDSLQGKGRVEFVHPGTLQKSPWPITPWDDNTVWRDMTAYGDVNNDKYFGGFKKEGRDRYKGVFVRWDHHASRHAEIELPYPYDQSGESGTPVVSIAGEPGISAIMVSGGNGMILFYDSQGDFIRAATPPYAGDTSEWYVGFMTIDGFGVCGDASGVIAKTNDLGQTWFYEHDGFDRDYSVQPDRIHHGRFAPLSVPNAHFDGALVAVGMNYGHFAVEQEQPDRPFTLVEVDPDADTTDSKWWWFTGTSSSGFIPGLLRSNYCFSGSDGIILRWDPDTTPSDWWERRLPEEFVDRADSSYWLNGIGYGMVMGNDVHRWCAGHKGKIFCAETRYGGTHDNPFTPNVGEPDSVQQFEAVYDAVFEGYRSFWQPPGNYLDTKVGAYWVCRTNDPGEWYVMNKAPIRRTTYFVKRPIGSYQDLRVCAMRRDGFAGPWSDWIWLNTIASVDNDETTGKNNARTLITDQDRIWSFWHDNNRIYTASSSDTGRYWSYRTTIPPYLGEGKWPAADCDVNDNPVVCWVYNRLDQGQVTARLCFARFDGSDWISALTLREEILTGSGYLYPSVSVDPDNNVHLVFGKHYHGDTKWQLWHAEFPVTDPANITWYCLDSTTTTPFASHPSTPTIGTDVSNRPLIIWNRPGSSTLYFGYCAGSAWTTYPLLFSGTMPCIEITGHTAFLTYVEQGDIWYVTGSIRQGFGAPRRVSMTLNVSSSPVIANNVIAWQEHTNNDWQIYYSFLNDNLTWTTPAQFFGYRNAADNNPQIIWYDPFAYTGWTQQAASPVVALGRQRIVTAEGDPPPLMAYDLGEETGAPILEQRAGYTQYGLDPAKSVDRGTLLKYRITGLHDNTEWRMRFLFYHESSRSCECNVVANDRQVGVFTIPPYQVIDRVLDIPTSLIEDHRVDIRLESMNNTDVGLGGVLVYAGKTRTGGGGH